MRTIFLTLVFLVVNSLSLAATPKHPEYVFSLNEKTGSVRELRLQITRSADMDVAVAEVHAKLADGKQVSGNFVCESVKGPEISCHRDDGGGEFSFNEERITLNFKSFDMADEGEEASLLVASPIEGADYKVSGKSVR